MTQLDLYAAPPRPAADPLGPTAESWELSRLRAALARRHHQDPARKRYQRDAIRKAIRRLREIRGQ